ncbi:hypothetical protein ACOTV8_02775 [Campylobacter jejuni]
MIEKTSNPASPAFWLTFAAICSFVALCAVIVAAIKNIKIALLESSPKEWRGGNS